MRHNKKKKDTLKGKLAEAEASIVEHKKAVKQLAGMYKKAQLELDLTKHLLNNDLNSKLKTRVLQVKEFNKAFSIHFREEIGEAPAEAKVMRVKMLREEIAEAIAAIEGEPIENVAKELADVFYIWAGAVLDFGLQNKIDAVFNAVHFSNMAKLVDGEPIYREDGKVLKPKGWVKPDINAILWPKAKAASTEIKAEDFKGDIKTLKVIK